MAHCSLSARQQALQREDVSHFTQTAKSLLMNPGMATTVASDIFRPTKFGGKYTVTLIPGDGVGAEVSESVKEIFKADNVPVEWEQVDVSGVEDGNKHSEELFRESIASLKRNKLGLKGMYSMPSSTTHSHDRHSAYAGRALWSSVIQCRSAARTRYLRLDRLDQEHTRLQNST